ncbi:hypothetical protein [Microcoleus sp. A003_D6]|uniref:hypothetical protein n=1 Tax=Microcoleus sp. A003_D6 TaxID=3055266 RepID=UPI002FD19921
MTLRPLRRWESGPWWGRRVFHLREDSDKLLTNRTNDLNSGGVAPIFSLRDAIGNLVSLADFLRRRVVLYF